MKIMFFNAKSWFFHIKNTGKTGKIGRKGPNFAFESAKRHGRIFRNSRGELFFIFFHMNFDAPFFIANF
jgi:hypothetical protein